MLLNFRIQSIEDCKKALHQSRSPQSKAVINACIVGIFYNVWIPRNKDRFDDIKTHWKTYLSYVTATVRVIGSHSARCSNSDMYNFSLFKRLDINIHPRRPLSTVSVIWSPPILGWIKCNVDGAAVGNPWNSACGGIYRDSRADHILNFSANIGCESPEIAIEKAKELKISKLWLESDCMRVVKAFKDNSLVSWKLKAR